MTIRGFEVDLDDNGKVVALIDWEQNHRLYPYVECTRYAEGRRYHDGWSNASGYLTPSQLRGRLSRGTAIIS